MPRSAGSLAGAVLKDMSQDNETSVFIDAAQREALLRGLFESYYHAIHPSQTVLDTNRGWTGRLDLLAKLYPECKVICCVRRTPTEASVCVSAAEKPRHRSASCRTNSGHGMVANNHGEEVPFSLWLGSQGVASALVSRPECGITSTCQLVIPSSQSRCVRPLEERR